MRERAIQVKTPRGWKTTGKLLNINGEWCYYRDISTKDKFRRFDAWSIQASIIPILQADRVTKIYQYVKDEKQVVMITLDDFINKSVERDFGAGKQFYVSAKYFTLVPGMKKITKYVQATELVA